MDLASSTNAVVFAQDSDIYDALPKSILCMPIYNGQRQVIGVAQLINKVRENKKNNLLKWHSTSMYVYRVVPLSFEREPMNRPNQIIFIY